MKRKLYENIAAPKLNRVLVEVAVERLQAFSLLRILLDRRAEVHHESRLLTHRHHISYPLLLSLAQAGDSSRQHTSVGSQVLRKNQHVGVFDVEAHRAFRAELLSFFLTLHQLLHKQRLVWRWDILSLDGDCLLLLVEDDIN